MNTTLLFVVIQLIFLEGILSLDNAAVLGAMVAPLPNNLPVPWPRPLQRLGHALDPLLGTQRDAALKVGLLGAYLGRGIMLGLATFIARNAWLRLIGGLYLLYLALHYLGMLGREQAAYVQDEHRKLQQTGFWSVVLAVELADLAFSLDNVVAAVGLSKDFRIILLGVAIGIVLMRFAASWFSRLIEWEPNLETAAYLLILAISVQVLLDDLLGLRFVPLAIGGITVTPEVQQFGVTLLILSLTIACSRIAWLRRVNVLWKPLLRVFAGALTLIEWLLWPVRALVRLFTGRQVEQA